MRFPFYTKNSLSSMADKKHFTFFASHATEADEHVRTLTRDVKKFLNGFFELNGYQLNFWIDGEDLRSADDFHPKIQAALKAAQGGILFLDRHAENSSYIMPNEWPAMKARKDNPEDYYPLFVVLIGKSKFTNNIHFKDINLVQIRKRDFYNNINSTDGKALFSFAEIVHETEKTPPKLFQGDLEHFAFLVAEAIEKELRAEGWGKPPERKDAKTNKNDDTSPTNPNKDMKNKLHALITALNYAGFFREADKLELDGSARANLNRLKLSFKQKTHEKDDFYSQRLELWVDSLEK